MKRTVKILAFILATVCALFGFSGCKKTGKAKLTDIVDFVLEVESGREVKILQLTDIQIIDSAQCRRDDRLYPASKVAWAIENIDNLAWKYIDYAVEQTSPDLIVLTGDNIYGEFDDKGTSIGLLIEKMDSYGIPWTLTYGNHDNETILGARWQNEQYQNAKNCLFKRGIDDAEGNGNFTIGITQGGKLTEVLFMLDSHGCVNSDKEEKVISTAGIFEGQLEWYSSVCSKLKAYNGGKNVKSLSFFHHALRAFGDGLQAYGYTSIKNYFYDASGNTKKFSVVKIGDKNENGDWGTVNTDGEFIDGEYEVFNLFKENGTEGVFFGHQHTNAASVTYKGVRLTFGVKSSIYDSYNSSLLGGTLIEVSANSFDVTPCYYAE